ncbi:MAG: potassium-transporting ATPase subunit C [Clostridiales bacterium]
MNKLNNSGKALKFLLLMTVVCGVLYTGAITMFAQIVFPHQANGSIIEVDGKKYGSELLAQQYTDETHMWGRIMNIDVSTYKDKNGKPLMYAAPSNISPGSQEFADMVKDRVVLTKAANPAMGNTPIPVDLVTCSGSGLDPQISLAAAAYQVPRLAITNNKTQAEIKEIISSCTEGKFLGLFGEKTVNVLRVNLILEGIL